MDGTGTPLGISTHQGTDGELLASNSFHSDAYSTYPGPRHIPGAVGGVSHIPSQPYDDGTLLGLFVENGAGRTSGITAPRNVPLLCDETNCNHFGYHWLPLLDPPNALDRIPTDSRQIQDCRQIQEMGVGTYAPVLGGELVIGDYQDPPWLSSIQTLSSDIDPITQAWGYNYGTTQPLSPRNLSPAHTEANGNSLVRARDPTSARHTTVREPRITVGLQQGGGGSGTLFCARCLYPSCENVMYSCKAAKARDNLYQRHQKEKHPDWVKAVNKGGRCKVTQWQPPNLYTEAVYYHR
ncbi:hypothetical protein TWF106_006311 [Orbilia oligospora]|uniref:Uncharacterized protein n=1 Tax=Orbilia oligospora TaxID=2813651 RepID=A0A7C8QZN3_ORBOL|nr:hypothetical protein TWF106_006311 [Orbilia oligospora]